MNQANPLYAATGAAGTFSLGALLEWARSPTTLGAFAFAGSVVSTGLGWFLARRREIARANLEIERDRRAAAREDRLFDALADVRIQAERSRPPVAYQPDRRADGRAGGRDAS